MARSCMNPLNGANPVPGPTITTGLTGRYGNRSDDRLIYTGILGQAPSNKGLKRHTIYYLRTQVLNSVILRK